MFWGPWVERYWSKKTWVWRTQLLTTVLLLIAGVLLKSTYFLPATLLVFFSMAFCSATHDIALDGYYMDALNPEDQARFVGIRSTAFRLAMIFCNGALLVLAGVFEQRGLALTTGWMLTLWLAATLFGILAIYGYWAMPSTNQAKVFLSHAKQPPFFEAWSTFFKQKNILSIVLFFIFYRFTEAMLSKMAAPFLLDPHEKGGLGLSTLEVGLIWGNAGILALVIGGVLGGYLVSVYGLRRCIWPMVATMTVPNFFYIWAAWALPRAGFVYALTIAEQFGYGFGMAGYMVFAMQVCRKSPFSTSHYAIVTGIMALGAMIAGITSGFVQAQVGYLGFFIIACCFTLPSLALVGLIPVEDHA